VLKNKLLIEFIRIGQQHETAVFDSSSKAQLKKRCMLLEERKFHNHQVEKIREIVTVDDIRTLFDEKISTKELTASNPQVSAILIDPIEEENERNATVFWNARVKSQRQEWIQTP